MRICHVITRLIIGGAQENTILSCRGLAELGHDVTLMAGPETGPEGSLWGQAQSAGYNTRIVNSLRRTVHPVHDIKAARELRRIFQELKPDVVHTHSSKAGILGRWAAAQAGVPIIVHTIHGMSFNRTQPSIVRAGYRALERWAAERTTAFVSVADAMTDQAVAAGIAPRERFTTIRSGMETERFAPDQVARAHVRGEWGIAGNEVVVGTIARLFKNKGYEEIIAAMPLALGKNQNLRFVWIGDGAQRAQYERQLIERGLRDRVRLLGLIPPERIPAVLNGFDLLVHASRWEGLPRAVVQGMLTEVPAVSFDNDGAPEVVTSGETGILVPLGDINALANGIVRLASNPDLRRDLARRARERCLSMFNWRTMVRELDVLYHRLQPNYTNSDRNY